MYIDFLLDTFRKDQSREAIIWDDHVYAYGWLLSGVQRHRDELVRKSVPEGCVVSLEADFSPAAISLLLALIEHKCIVVPLADPCESRREECCSIAGVEYRINVTSDRRIALRSTGVNATHSLIGELRKMDRPGLVLFSSG